MWYCILFYALTEFTAKLSILFLFMSIFTFDWIRWAIKISLAIVIVTNVFILVSLFTACIPLEAYWDMTVIPTYCQSQSIYWANTGVHIGTDILIYLLPSMYYPDIRVSAAALQYPENHQHKSY